MVFPRKAAPEEMQKWIYREWRVTPGRRDIEIFGVGTFLKHVVSFREGVRVIFEPEVEEHVLAGGARRKVSVYKSREVSFE